MGSHRLFPFLIVIAAVWAEPNWQTNFNKEGILIETRPVQGSAYREFRATMVVGATLTKAEGLMNDIPGYTRWMKDCKEARRVSKSSPTSGIVYSLQATPWPITEREAVVRYEYKRSKLPAALNITIAAEPDALPMTPGKVRISQLKGYWKFTDVGSGKIEVVYSMHSEPGGNLPAWAASGMVAHLPFETLKKLRVELER